MGNINDRIAMVVEKSNLSKTAFAERINVSQQYISKLTKQGIPSDRTIADICREFNVSEIWLRTGEGEMFIQLSDDEEFLQIMTDIQVSDDPFIRSILKAYWLLSDEKKAVIREFVDSIQTKEKAGN